MNRQAAEEAPIDANIRARNLYRSWRRGEIPSEVYYESVARIFYGPLRKLVENLLTWRSCKTYDPEDLMEDTFLRFLENNPDLEQGKAFSWLWSVADRLLIDHLRRQSKITSAQLDGDQMEATTPAANRPDSREWVVDHTVRAVLAEIDERWLPVLLLHYRDELTEMQIAERLGLSRATVDFYLRSAREILKKKPKLIELLPYIRGGSRHG